MLTSLVCIVIICVLKKRRKCSHLDDSFYTILLCYFLQSTVDWIIYTIEMIRQFYRRTPILARYYCIEGIQSCGSCQLLPNWDDLFYVSEGVDVMPNSTVEHVSFSDSQINLRLNTGNEVRNVLSPPLRRGGGGFLKEKVGYACRLGWGPKTRILVSISSWRTPLFLSVDQRIF